MYRTMEIDYLSFRFWINAWTAFIMMILVSGRYVHACIGQVATDASALVKYITRFTEEAFATLVAVLFVYEAMVKIINMYKHTSYIEYSAVGGVC